MYSLAVKPTADRAFRRLARKDREQLRRFNMKVREILKDPHRFKPLRHPLDGCRRVHVGSFVIIYEVDEKNKTVIILDYDHHVNIYL